MSEEKFVVKVGEEDKTIIVKHPTPRVEAEANMHASRVFSKLSKERGDGNDGLLLRAQLDKFLRDAGLYTDDDIKVISDLSDKITDLEAKLTAPVSGTKKSEGRTIAIELRRSRYNLLLLLAKRMEYDKNTIEHFSENARINYIIVKSLLDENGAQIFKSVEDYEFDETGLKEALDLPIRKIASMSSVYDTDYESKLVENKFLKKYGFCNDEFDLIDSNGNRVNEKGQRVDEEGNLLDESGNLIKVAEKEIGEFLED